MLRCESSTCCRISLWARPPNSPCSWRCWALPWPTSRPSPSEPGSCSRRPPRCWAGCCARMSRSAGPSGSAPSSRRPSCRRRSPPGPTAAAGAARPMPRCRLGWGPLAAGVAVVRRPRTWRSGLRDRRPPLPSLPLPPQQRRRRQRHLRQRRRRRCCRWRQHWWRLPWPEVVARALLVAAAMGTVGDRWRRHSARWRSLDAPMMVLSLSR
mmetsp:Transcript_117687/g.375051  ORF Transcript_117687/g.375051 Transcript_117687/m.375051 type:complete len:210 (+) Transcript_117687:1939-2568(+)